jgi:hypothetical protein
MTNEHGRTARNWYRWLWLSPLLTIPTLLALREVAFFISLVWCFSVGSGLCNEDAIVRLTTPIAVLGSALWHLVLLIPALNKKHPFIRCHGRQALLLAGVRTAVPLACGLGFGPLDFEALPIIAVVMIVIWLGGTLWGQRQAGRGDCSLMRWFGRAEALPRPEPAEEPTQVAELDTEALVDVIRHSSDPEERRQALAELEKRGMVDSL